MENRLFALYILNWVILVIGEWFFKNSGSRKILVEFHGSRSLVFWAGYVRLAVSFFIRRCLGVSKHFDVSVSQSKKSKCLGLAKKTLVSPSRKVSCLPFANPYISWRRLCYTVGGWILSRPRAVETDAESAIVCIYLGEFDSNER